ncbi:hypothetical protein ACEPAG_4665 [Sanghuangporus baumii]
MSSSKATLLPLPFEVLSAIWIRFSYKELGEFRKAIPEYSNAISYDKRLWTRFFDDYEKQQKFVFPSFFRNIEDVVGRDVESWIAHAVALKQEYKKQNKQVYIRKIDIQKNLRVTWLKLVLGHWCLVAVADERESVLYIYDADDQQCKSKTYLEAPVLDGRVDWSSGEVICAITVGTRKPYILVLGLYQSPENVILRRLGHIRNASHVRYLQGDQVGFAVRDGDDTFPYIANWRTGTLYYLRFPHSHPQMFCPLPIESCKAITTENGLVFALHRTTVQIFEIPDGSTEGSLDRPVAKHLISLSFRWTVAYGEFVKVTAHSREGQSVLRVIFEDEGGHIQQAVIKYDAASREANTFSMHDFDIKSHPTVNDLHLCHAGSSGRTMLCMTRQDRLSYAEDNSIYLGSLVPTDDAKEGDPLGLDGGFSQISKDGFPLLHLVSSIDFDDGYGLILMGNVLGDVRLASFLPEPIITPESMRKLGMLVRPDVDREMSFESPVTLDLPYFYELRKDHTLCDQVYRDVSTRITSEWTDPRVGTLTIGRWSNNWIEFDDIGSWIQPLSRWGPLDRDFLEESGCTDIRNRLQILGEIIPVLYGTRNHAEVIFRVGQRMYYSLTRRKVDDGDLFEFYDDGYLGILPITYDQFVDDPREINFAVSDMRSRTNLAFRCCSDCLYKQIVNARVVYRIIDHQEEKRGAPLESSEIESWSDEHGERNLEMLPEIDSSDDDDDGDECKRTV